MSREQERLTLQQQLDECQHSLDVADDVGFSDEDITKLRGEIGYLQSRIARLEDRR